MCGGGPLPGNPTSSNSANAPPVSLPSALNVTSSRSPIQTDLPSPAATWVVLMVDFLLPCWYDVTLADYRLPSIRTPPGEGHGPNFREPSLGEVPGITLLRTRVNRAWRRAEAAMNPGPYARRADGGT